MMMHISCRCSCKQGWLSLDVKRIEVDPIYDDSDDEPYPQFFREIRIQTADGEVLELILASEDKRSLGFRRKQAILIESPQDESVDWLTPKDSKPVPEKV